MHSEENLARRVAYERERRGWSYEGTAARMTVVGCAVQGSAIYKIEKGSPRRRISVDELVAFANIFELELPDLLIPPELLADEQAILVARIMEQGREQIALMVISLGLRMEQLRRIMGPADADGVLNLIQNTPPACLGDYSDRPDIVSLVLRVLDMAVGGTASASLQQPFRRAVSEDE